MDNNEKLRNLADGACDEMQCLKDTIDAYIKWKQCGLTVAKKDIDDVIEQCNAIKSDIDAIVSIVSKEVQ